VVLTARRSVDHPPPYKWLPVFWQCMFAGTCGVAAGMIQAQQDSPSIITSGAWWWWWW